MKQTNRIKRLFSLILTAAMLLGLMLPAHAATPETSALRFRQVDNSAVSAELRQDTADEIQDAPDYASTDLVRVSIVLDQKSTLEAGFSTADIAGNASAMSYRADLRDNQADVAARIAGVTKEPLDVVWNLTLAAKHLLRSDSNHSESSWREGRGGGDPLRALCGRHPGSCGSQHGHILPANWQQPCLGRRLYRCRHPDCSH